MKLIIVFLMLSANAFASLPELFSSSASTMGIGNQSTLDIDDAGACFSIPALAAFSEESSVSINVTSVNTSFNKISNIVTENSINSASATPVSRDVDPNLSSQNILSMHAGLKLFKNSNLKFLASFYTPIDKLLEASTGDPYLPEYRVYNSRLQRSLFYFNFAHKLTDSFAYSLGVITGIQSSGLTNVVARENGAPFEPSLGKMSFNATPSIAPSFSIFKKWSNVQASYFSYTYSMKSNFTNEATGITPVGNSALKYDWTFNSLIYFDPSILRLGHAYQLHHFKLFTSLEYLGWSEYKTAKLEMINNGGILAGTNDYENFSTKNILVPKLGLQYEIGSKIISFGLSYKPNPFTNDLSQAGNSIDSDSIIYSAGFQTPINLFENKFNLTIAGQIHDLKEFDVKKSINNENNEAGSKIGSPGYSVGGSVFVASFGLNWVI